MMRPILCTTFDLVMDRLYQQEKLSYEESYHMKFPISEGGNKCNIHSFKKWRQTKKPQFSDTLQTCLTAAITQWNVQNKHHSGFGCIQGRGQASTWVCASAKRHSSSWLLQLQEQEGLNSPQAMIFLENNVGKFQNKRDGGVAAKCSMCFSLHMIYHLLSLQLKLQAVCYCLSP